MRLNACGSKVLVLLVLSAVAGCEGQRTIAGPTQPPSGGNVPAATIAVLVEGRIIHGDSDAPVPGAVVVARGFCAPGVCTGLNQPAARAIADDQGAFVLTVNLLPNWSTVDVQVTRDGFEPTRWFVRSTAATSAVLTLLPIVTIRPGESIETRVFFGTYVCGDESWICRRIVVESGLGESMDLEVIPGDGQFVGLIVGPESTHPISPSPPRQVTMSAGEVWIYGAVGKVTLTARRVGP